ncbi:UDP-N-acetylglucosamine:LPS N-acetylglucosamine transferase [Nocardioides ginsengisegetis]|uniref:UDP-N-acetylglucosamine:LPS N-acetylglucosamine transferase n=1 Tax=Nocardioides ginsengisegetis TaxID=661491 RepID=A0A7W3J3P9_9ACTN|nr:galactosyldiacylglycerol synthase [Nocardioides ginsengisegetis]MBA8805703.1 UDP-N-acetylglucosamine:LPS N-acetylglucosamine transferase [Nocardioides ginsengisegetis]
MTAMLEGPATASPSLWHSRRRGPGFPFLDPEDGPAEVHIVSGSFGAGHDAAAREIAIRLTAQGHLVQVWDVVDLFPAAIGRILRAAYLKQLEVSPTSWGVLLRHLQPGGVLHRLVTRALAITARRLLGIARGSDLVVSTHPFASQALGRLRMRGRLTTPVVTYLTDLSVHPLWVHRFVDHHLALHDIAARQAVALGGRASVIEPLVPHVDPDLVAPEGTRAVCRAAWGLEPGTRLALVVGGSLGIGELTAAALDVLATGLAVPVVLCGHNAVLQRRLELVTGVVALGWRDDLPTLLRAVDLVIQNAGGFTSLEALDAGVPVLTYRCLPGHGMTNAAALEEAGLVPWVRSPEELSPALVEAFAQPQAPLPAPTRPTLVHALATQRVPA